MKKRAYPSRNYKKKSGDQTREQNSRQKSRSHGKVNKRPTIKPGADKSLKTIFQGIGIPDKTPFTPDPFQLDAVEAIKRDRKSVV